MKTKTGLAVKTVTWVVDGKRVAENELGYPMCAYPEEDCQDMLTIDGHYICDVWNGEFSSCPYKGT